jgi:integrase
MSTRSRRVMGHGTIYRRSNGTWAGEITVDGKRSTAYAPTQAECVARLQVLQAQAAGGLPAVDQHGTVSAYLAGWLETKRPKLRPSTMARYKGIVAGQIIPELGRVKLAKLQPVDVDRMLARLQAQGLSPRTASHVRAVLRAALATALRRGQVVRNVATLSEPVRVAKVPLRILSPDAAWGLLGAIEAPQLRRLATLAVHSGLRQGELLGLVWNDVDWTGGQLHVSQALQRIEGSYRRVEVKSGSSRRAVPLTPAAVEVLTAEWDAQAAARERAGSRWREPIPGLIFTTATGQPRNGTTISRQFADALAAANLAPMPFHDLRHAFATLMFASGVDSGTVSALLGHSSVSLTMSTYAGVAPSLKRQATDQLARLLAGPESEVTVRLP